MQIRRANEGDLERINELLYQVLDIHYQIRPDIFKKNAKKYTDNEILDILKDDSRPVFVLDTDELQVAAYAFCVVGEQENEVLAKLKNLYIDDLCVDKSTRGAGLGKILLDFVKDYARTLGCYNVTLNVWHGNDGAERFYEKCGFAVQKTYLEEIL
jgi:ribosomal protein S18 acetylase RimI-like enzyme